MKQGATRRRRGRGWAGLALGLLLGGLCLVAPRAWAGSYLDRSALLLEEARREGDVCQARLGDREFLGMLLALAEARAKAAQKMEVPAATARAHPHLLLALVDYASAYEAALGGNFKRFVEQVTAARAEEKNFRARLKELGHPLEDLR